MKERPATLDIQVAVGPGDDAEEIAEATLQLRRELLDLDVDAVELPSAGEAPPGTRAVELAALGALAVTVPSHRCLVLWWRRYGHGSAGRRSAASSWSSTATPWS
jgi:hypothetical protein